MKPLLAWTLLALVMSQPDDPAVEAPIQPPKPVAPFANAEGKSEPKEVKVFYLEQADAAAVERLLRQLYGDALAISTETSRNRAENGLFVRGTPDLITEVEALVILLDRAPEAGQDQPQKATASKKVGRENGERGHLSPASGSTPGGGMSRMESLPGGMSDASMLSAVPMSPSPEELRKQYEVLERKAAELARRARDQQSQRKHVADQGVLLGGVPSHDELRNVVAQAFAARQRLHRAELAELEQRLKTTRETLALRDQIKETIIQRRVEELLNPALQWAPESESVDAVDAQPAAREQGGSAGLPATQDVVLKGEDGKHIGATILSVDDDKKLLEISVDAGTVLFRGAAYEVYNDMMQRLARITISSINADRVIARFEQVDRPATAAQLQITAPESVVIWWTDRDASGKRRFDGPPVTTGSGLSRARPPALFRVTPGETVGFALNEIPDRSGLRLYSSVAIASPGEATSGFLNEGAIPINITLEDVDQAASGNSVVKAIYLPRNESIETRSDAAVTIVSTRLDPGVDPVAEAQRRGHLLAVMRLERREMSLGEDEQQGPRMEYVFDGTRDTSFWRSVAPHGPAAMEYVFDQNRHPRAAVRAYTHVFRPEVTAEHRQAVFERLQKDFPSLTMNAFQRGDQKVIQFFAKDDDAAAKVVAALKQYDQELSATRPTKDPRQAVVWIEAVFESAEGPEHLEAAYLNGTVIANDGLIAVAIDPKTMPPLDRLVSAKVTLFDERVVEGKLVARDPTTNAVALIQVEATGLPFLELSNEPIVKNRGLKLYAMSESRHDSARTMAMDARIVKTVLADMPGCFQIHTPPPGVQYRGSPLVSATGKLEGITGGTMEDGGGIWNASAATLKSLVRDWQKTQPGDLGAME